MERYHLNFWGRGGLEATLKEAVARGNVIPILEYRPGGDGPAQQKPDQNPYASVQQMMGKPPRMPGGRSAPLGDAQPFEYTPGAVGGNVEELAASTNNPNYAAKMLGFDRKTFGSMIHAMKDDLDLGAADNVIWHDDGSVEFRKNIIGNMFDYAN